MEDYHILKNTSDSFTLSDSAKALVTEDRTISRPKATDGIRSNGYFDYIYDRDPPLPPKFKKLYHYHLHKLEAQAELRRIAKASEHATSAIPSASDILPPTIK